MKRFAAMLTVAGLAMFAIPGVTSAQTGYNTPSPTFSDTTPGPGEAFDVGITNCVIDTEVVFTFLTTVKTETCAGFTAAGGSMFGFFGTAAPATGSASATFTAPTAPGTYTGTINLVTPDGPDVVSFSITVEGAAAATTTVAPAGGLPATGSSGSSTTVIIASILLLAGLGMFGVAQMRRRQAVA